jgi:hypothetical protein
VSFESVEAVDSWAKANGGADALRMAMVTGTFNLDAKGFGHVAEWLSRQEEARRTAADAALMAPGEVGASSSSWLAWAVVAVGILAILLAGLKFG